MEQWKEYKLGDICRKVCSGGTPSSKRSEYYDGDIPWLNTKEINFNRIYKTEKCITEEGLKNSSAKWIEANSVIVAMYGATAGKSAITKIPLTTNQACCNLTINSDVADYRYVYYFLCHKFYKLASLANGGAQQNLNAQIIKDFSINLPSLTEQMRIADVLSSLDDKIEVNMRINDNFHLKLLLEALLIWWVSILINENLEQQAQALFKSWFVDFEPFKDGEFIISELGRIPKGWKVQSLDDMTSKFGTGLNPRQNFKLGEGENFYVTIKNMSNNRVFLDERCDKVNNEALEKINKRSKLKKGDLLFSGIGTIGRVALITETPTNWNTSESVFNLHPQEDFSSEFLYLLLLSEKFQNYVKIHAQGGVQQGIRMASLKEYKMAIPPLDILKQFDSIVIPLISKIKNNDKEMDILSLNRNFLLPKLMSGELKVNDLAL